MKIDYPLPKELSEAEESFVRAALERSLDVEALIFSAANVTADLRDHITEEKFGEIMRNLLYVARSINRKVLYENSVRHPCNVNPMQALQDAGDVTRVGDGMFSFQGAFLNVLKACQDYSFRLAKKYDALEQDHPVLWPVDLYRKINYFNEFPQQVIMGAPVHRDYDTREDFAESYEKSKAYDTVSMKGHFDDASYGLQCAVCDICYYNMRGRRNHQNTIYTTVNKVFRNESSATGSLDRLTNFTVRDIMFVGDKDFVLLYRQKMLDEAAELLRSLNLECKLETADDPFFTNDTVVKNLFQNSSELKHELLVRLNYADSWMAVGSVNMHLDFFGDSFDIRLPDDSPVYSGCFGIGFERLTFALYCQYGVDTEAWPECVKKTLSL